MWEALAARKLFAGSTNAEILRAVQVGNIPSLKTFRPDVPDVFADLVLQSIRRDPSTRWSSARAMAIELLSIVRAIRPIVDARRLGASVVQAKERLGAVDEQMPITIDNSGAEDSIEIGVDMEVDFNRSPTSTRSFRAELSEPFET
ncbi:MAG: hypothetical protein CSA75_04790 [Sorangium cellulosum]|nr:MAG: hypothetical protein CSA75_04790 [Sorangium cellulosum]